MSDLVSRIDSRIHQIQALLGETEKPNGPVEGRKKSAAFDQELLTQIAGLPHSSLPPLGGLGINGLEPFKPGIIKPLDPAALGLQNDPLAAILSAESGQKNTPEIGVLSKALEAYGKGPAREPKIEPGPPR